MRPKKHIVSHILGFALVINLAAQDTQNWVSDHLNVSGYVKFLNTSSFISLDSIANDNLIHNRTNIRLYANDDLTLGLELRNRVFWGTSVRSFPNFVQSVKNPNQDINLDALLIHEPAILMLSTIDRLYVDYHKEKWQLVVGRQRINWGKNLVWNPNDLFNAYNFLDFDYEERPGADALRAKYFTSGDSSFEFAISYAKVWRENTVALKYNFNKHQYDFQLIAAKFLNDLTLGIGWEGVIKDVGFKGELSYFMPNDRSEGDNALVGSISFDYYFANDMSINISTLYNSDGAGDVDFFGDSLMNNATIDAKNLMPNKWSLFGQFSKTFTPAITGSMASIYAVDLNSVFLTPQFTYNISQNWDFDVTGQIFYGKQEDEFKNLGNSIFLRFRYSF
ncbi:hypothetical protein L0P88_16215 [Muricauda sp. SCSIO 64092]|uniref:hypothetical protein n=1 Tax=Allomuricauda sp. SCSIO 64092 TaxID=2908842 RepID=UPI001FF0FF4E|nr:hypothetical protein [Muricauda sp. SCSIO 64092]UOY05489.1 hypothetical protein L0P88_16215 [Muricauda sp. SCSIO 64092]